MAVRITLVLVAYFVIVAFPAVHCYDELPHCVHQNNSYFMKTLVFVSTLDGRMTALNSLTGGMVVWSIDTGPGPLLSSSIDKLELTNNGQWVRMIPSLSGGIYKFNGISIETVPVSADHLLQASSLLLSDGLVILGGKESRIYGIATDTGEVLYECSMKGCDNYNVSDNVVVIQRHTKTVRAVDFHTGNERWNFSVGQHEVKLSVDSSCHVKQSEVPSVDFDLKAILPEGLIYAIDKVKPEKILWKHKFDSPIVAVWQIENDKMKPVDLFNDVSPAKETETTDTSTPALYVGMHKKQLYIQERKPLWERMRKDVPRLLHEKTVIPWHPIPATSSALGITSEEKETETTALSVLYASEYVNGNGYYLVVDENVKHANQCSVTEETVSDEDNDNSEENTPVNIVIISLWYWWKEVLIISITTAVLVNLLIAQRVMHIVQTSSEVIRKEIIVEKPVESKRSTDSSSSSLSEGSQNSGYMSRYLTDFEPVRCLGEGGFGVVFEAKNKIDECNYAIKRIVLPNSSESRDRVLREVKALAKLDHQNIVRYFNAWTECPPAGWMEQHDLLFQKLDQNLQSDIIDIESTDPDDPDETTTEHNTRETTAGRHLPSVSEETRSFQKTCDKSDSFIVFENPEETSTNKRTFDRSGQYSVLLPEKCSDGEFSKTKDCIIPIPQKRYLYIQMQLCHRKSLRDWLKENVESRDKCKTFQIFEEIVQAVEYIHLEGLIHRDLKPSNIFFSKHGQIKVGDFGLVTAMDQTVVAEDSDKLTISDSSVKNHKHTAQVGTQLYMSPEQVNGEPYDYKVDIYSLGLIFFELLYPFSTQMERVNVLLDLRKNVFPLNFQEAFHEEYELLSLMLSHHPERRPTTFGIRARPPLCRTFSTSKEEQRSELHHFELPAEARKRSRSSSNAEVIVQK